MADRDRVPGDNNRAWPGGAWVKAPFRCLPKHWIGACRTESAPAKLRRFQLRPINGAQRRMTMRILWPNMPTEWRQVARDAIGDGFEAEFCNSFDEVTDDQWANAD